MAVSAFLDLGSSSLNGSAAHQELVGQATMSRSSRLREVGFTVCGPVGFGDLDLADRYTGTAGVSIQW